MNSESAIIAGLILVSLISMKEIVTHCAGLAKVKQPFWVLHIWSFGCAFGAFHHILIYGKYRVKFADDTVSLAIYLFLVLIWYLNIRISFPKIAPNGDLKNYYFRRKHAFMGLWMFILVLSFGATSLIMDEGILNLKNIFRLSFAITVCILFFENVQNIHHKTVLHGGLIALSLIQFIAYMLIFA